MNDVFRLQIVAFQIPGQHYAELDDGNGKPANRCSFGYGDKSEVPYVYLGSRVQNV